MVYVRWKLEHTPFTGTGYDTGNTTNITSFFDPILETNLGSGRDMFKFKVQNNRGIYNNFFKVKDKITVYRKVNSGTFTSDDIVMVAAVEKVPYKNNGTVNVMNVDCYNYSEAVMSAIVFVDAQALSASAAIKQGLANVSNLAPNFSVTWDNAGNGTTTQVVGKRYFYKTLLSMIEELSEDKYTGDGRYFWYVNNDNEFIWKKDTAYGQGSFNSSTTPYREMGTKIDTSKVINYIITKGGILPNGKQVQDYVPDFASIAGKGYKYHIETGEANTVQELVKSDQDSDGVETTDGYPDLSSSFTTAWKWSGNRYDGQGVEQKQTIDGILLTNTQSVTINQGSESANKETYNNILRAQVISLIRKKARDILEVRSKGKFILELETLPGQEQWALGDRISCVVPEIFYNSTTNSTSTKLLRIQEYQLTTDSEIFELEEDTGSV